MNDAIKRVITGIVAGIALAASFAAKVNAEEMELIPEADIATAKPAVPQPEAQQESTSEDAPTPEAEQSDAEPAETAVNTEPENTDTQDMQTVAEEESEETTALQSEFEPDLQETFPAGASDAETAAPEAETDPVENPAGNESGEASGSVTVGGITLGETENNSGWDGNKGWRYDGQSISLINNDTAVDIHAEEQGVVLSAAGFNRIGTLYADGDVNITGTGILLIDEIDLLEGASLNLQTNTDIYEDGTGSAAIFLRNEEDGCYYLINGSVPGILDGKYEIPEGVHLVIPEDACIDMRVLDYVQDVQNDGNGDEVRNGHYGIQADDSIGSFRTYDDGLETITALEISFPSLTIQEGATLTIAQGGTLKMDTTDYLGALASYISGTAKLIVNGVLELWGEIIGSIQTALVPDVIVQETGSITGEGVMSEVDVDYRKSKPTQDNIYLGDYCNVVVQGYGPTVHAQGKRVRILYGEGSTLAGIEVTESCNDDACDHTSCDHEVFLYPLRDGFPLNLDSTPVDPGNLLRYVDGMLFINHSQYGVDVEEESRRLAYRVDNNDWNFTVSLHDYKGAVCFFRDLLNGLHGTYGGKYIYLRADLTKKGEFVFNAGHLKAIGYNDLLDTVLKDYTSPCVRIDYLEDGKMKTAFLTSSSTERIDTSQICGIQIWDTELSTSVGPAVGGVSTSTTNTGVGVLGGSNAGSLTGGAYTPVLGGSRRDPASSGSSEEPGNSNPGNSDPGNSDPGNSDPGNSEPGNSEPGNSTPDEPGNGNSDNGDPIPDDSDDTDNAADPSSTANYYLDIRVSGSGLHLAVNAYLNSERLQTLNGGTVKARFRTDLPSDWNRKDLFAVFRNEDGSITVIKVYSDPATGILSFDTPILGEFDLICLHWEDDNYESSAFYAAVEKMLVRKG